MKLYGIPPEEREPSFLVLVLTVAAEIVVAVGGVTIIAACGAMALSLLR